MVKLGFFASLEEFSPRECIDQTVLAEKTGFDTVWVNDHFHPWFDHFEDETPAHGGNCWTWLPAALERTNEIAIGTGVTAILNRYHPANVAHRLATMMELYPDRVFLGIGAGEALNEKPLGNPWPDYGERARRTAEAIRIIKRLFIEDYVDFDGTFWTLDSANLYTGPNTPPPIHVAAFGSTAARMAGDLGNGLLTVYQDPESVKNVLYPALERGVEKSATNSSVNDIEKTVLIHCSYAESMSAALKPCKPWRVTLLPVFFEHGIHDPRYLQAHGELVGTEQLESEFLVSTDPDDFRDVVETYVECGFDRILFQSSSPDQRAFCEMIEREVMPSFDQ